MVADNITGPPPTHILAQLTVTTGRLRICVTVVVAETLQPSIGSVTVSVYIVDAINVTTGSDINGLLSPATGNQE